MYNNNRDYDNHNTRRANTGNHGRKNAKNARSSHRRGGASSGKYDIPISYSPHNSYRYERRRPRFNPIKYLYRLLIILVFAVVLAGVISALFYLNLTKTRKNGNILYEFIYGEEKSQKVDMPFNTAVVNGEYYIPINSLMSILNWSITGDKSEISFISSTSDNFLKFKVDTPVVYVNNAEYFMSSPSILDKADINSERLYVPLEFIEKKFNNLSVNYGEENKNHIVIEIVDTQVAFRLHAVQSLESPFDGVEPPSTIEFKADLSEYEQYFSPENRDEYIVLVNQTHPLEPQDYVPPDLIDVVDTRKDGRAMQQLRVYPAKALEAFLIEARANGHQNITVTSAYRSFESQTSIFNSRVAEQMAVLGDIEAAEAAVSLSTAYPGCSEHQSGLSLDMHTLGSAVSIFGETPAGSWLAENAHHFGYILRYPEGKTDITGIMYEPWHFRYVGRYHATRMYDLGMCLEEYTDYLASKAN